MNIVNADLALDLIIDRDKYKRYLKAINDNRHDFIEICRHDSCGLYPIASIDGKDEALIDIIIDYYERKIKNIEEVVSAL